MTLFFRQVSNALYLAWAVEHVLLSTLSNTSNRSRTFF